MYTFEFIPFQKSESVLFGFLIQSGRKIFKKISIDSEPVVRIIYIMLKNIYCVNV